MEKMVSVAEAADVLGVHPATVQRAIRRGDIPATKLGRQWRVRMSDLEPTYHGDAPAPKIREQQGRFARLASSLAGTGARTPSA